MAFQNTPVPPYPTVPYGAPGLPPVNMPPPGGVVSAASIGITSAASSVLANSAVIIANAGLIAASTPTLAGAANNMIFQAGGMQEAAIAISADVANNVANTANDIASTATDIIAGTTNILADASALPASVALAANNITFAASGILSSASSIITFAASIPADIIADSGSLLEAVSDDAPGVNGAFGTSQWGLYANGEPAIVSDSVVKLSFKASDRISDAIQEKGAFLSYNKVTDPFTGIFRFATGSTPGARSAFIASVVAAQASLDLFDFVMPDYSWPNCNVVHYDFARDAHNGLSLLQIDVWIEEVRITGTSAFSNTAAPSGADPAQNGTQQPVKPTPAQVSNVQPNTAQSDAANPSTYYYNGQNSPGGTAAPDNQTPGSTPGQPAAAGDLFNANPSAPLPVNPSGPSSLPPSEIIYGAPTP